MERAVITDFLMDYLRIKEFKDSTYNGLQVEGKSGIQKIGFAVDCSIKTFQLAIEKECDMLVTHHGLIWDSVNRIDGTFRQKIHLLLSSDTNLFVCHLPLDAHSIVGNNVQIAKVLGANVIGNLGDVSVIAGWEKAMSISDLQKRVGDTINKNHQTLAFGNSMIHKAVVSSGAWRANHLEEISNAGVDTLIAGEPMGISMFTDSAIELNMNVIFAGHYETEVFGLKALMEVVNNEFGNQLELEFIDNPHPMPDIPSFANA